MEIFQTTLTLWARKREFHLITDEPLPEIKLSKTQICQVFVQHSWTSKIIWLY